MAGFFYSPLSAKVFSLLVAVHVSNPEQTMFFALAQDPALQLSFACPYTSVSCCGTLAGAAQIAAQHVNNRNGSLVSELASLQNATISVSAQDRDYYTSAYELVKASQEVVTTGSLKKADAYLAFYYSSDVISAHEYFVEKNLDTPLIGWGAASPVFNEYPTYYQNFYSLYPNDAMLATQMARLFFHQFGFKFVAVISEPDAWSDGFAKVFAAEFVKLVNAGAASAGGGSSSSSSTISPSVRYKLSADSPITATECQTTLQQIRKATARVVLYVSGYAAHLQTMLLEARRLTMAGPQAKEYVWAALNLGTPGTVYRGAEYHNMLTLSPRMQDAAAESKMQQLRAEMWTAEMAAGPLPTGAIHGLTATTGSGPSKLPVVERQQLLVGCEEFLPYVYDGVAAAALGYEAQLLNHTTSTYAVGVAAGVNFHGLSGPVAQQSPSGIRNWGLRPARRYNLLQIQNDGVLTQLTNFTDAASMSADTWNTKIQWATSSGTTPKGHQQGACFIKQIQCNEGYCVNEGAGVGFKGGWCECNPGYAGPTCDVKSSVPLTRGAGGGPEGRVAYADVFWKRLGPFDEVSFSAELIVTQIYLDERTRINDGHYPGTEVETLLGSTAGPNLFLPLVKTAVTTCKGGVAKQFTTGTRAEVKYPLIYARTVYLFERCQTDPSWDYYPFDKQKLFVDITPVYDAKLSWLFDFEEFWTQISTNQHVLKIETSSGSTTALLVTNSTTATTSTTVAGTTSKAAAAGGDDVNKFLDHKQVMLNALARDRPGVFEYPGVPETVDGTTVADDWNPSWPCQGATLQYDVTTSRAALTLEVERDANLWRVRIAIPAILLGTFAFSTFIVPPDKLVPRFMSGYLAFLALQSFRTSATNQAPDSLISLGYLDVLLLYLTLSMSGCVIAVMAGEIVFQKLGPTVVRECDALSKRTVPTCYFLTLLIAMVGAGEDNPLDMTVDSFFAIAMTSAILPGLFYVTWLTILVRNCDHFYLYNCIKVAQDDPAAPCVLKDLELQAMFRWISIEYQKQHPHQAVLAADQEESDDHEIPVDVVAKYLLDAIKGDLDLERCIFFTKILYDECDSSGDGKIDVTEWKQHFPKVIQAVARGKSALLVRSRLYLFHFYVQRMFNSKFQPKQLVLPHPTLHADNSNNLINNLLNLGGGQAAQSSSSPVSASSQNKPFPPAAADVDHADFSKETTEQMEPVGHRKSASLFAQKYKDHEDPLALARDQLRRRNSARLSATSSGGDKGKRAGEGSAMVVNVADVQYEEKFVSDDEDA
ncbi:unnamed protein product [Amoebophrya sp. A120]|nr:unnamed protein product [Amoebophrya sp. A120]|eukprot:GSA120T00000225001.1